MIKNSCHPHVNTMKGKKKIKSLDQSEEILEVDELKNFLEAENADLQKHIDLNPDPFEAYFHTKCKRWLNGTDEICSRIETGYRTVFKEILQK